MIRINIVTREEKKYLINYIDYKKYSGYFEKVLNQDSHNGSNGYLVRSLYFDTLNDQDFVNKIDGVEIRHKIRLRIYSTNDDFAVLEHKQKQGDYQKKRSMKVTKEDAYEIINSNYSVLLKYKNEFAIEMYALMSMNCYRPKTIVQYNRKAFVAKENRIRLTFDNKIVATESNFDIFSDRLCFYPALEESMVVFEVKYNGFLLSYIKDIVNEVNKSNISVSKYCLGRSIICQYVF